MGIAIPQVVTEDRASGALVVDGSLKFDKDKLTYLSRTPGSSGNRDNWTISCWLKRDSLDDNQRFFESGNTAIRFGAGNFQWIDGSSASNGENTPAAVLRDINGWYHCVFAWNSSAGVFGNRIYVNGAELTYNQTGSGNPSGDSAWNTGSVVHTIGQNGNNSGRYYGGRMSQVYFIDGLTLGPSYFGFTDPLTGTWRPEKFKAEGTTINDGTVWSNSISGTADSGWSKTQSFDGILTSSSRASNGNSLTWTPSTPIPIKHSLKIYGRKRGDANAVLTVNGTNYASLLTEGAETFITVPESHITTVVWSNVNGNSDSVDIGGFEVDGDLMKDSTTQNLAFGTNGFYLPMDGNSPIGEDKSGKGNNWTPVNFGGSVALDNPIVSGARPILNTTAGVVARPGVFGSEVGAFYATTSASNSGGKYYFSHDASAQPTFSFIRGATYTFDYSASSSHPLRFATAADAAGSTEYTDGTSISGNVIKFTVPHNAPNTLYYYCNVHNGMGNSISVTTDESKADPYAWKCVLALPLVGSDDDVSNSVNSGSTTKVTTSASSAVASSAQSNFYGGSWLFDGTDDYIAVTDNAELAFGTGDSTVELWVYPNTLVSNDVLYDSRQSTGGATTGFSIVVNNTGMVSTYTAGGYRCQSTSQLKVGKWSHVAVVRSSGTDTLFIDGIAQADTDTTGANYTDQKCRIASDVNGAEAWGGYISDFRLYKGVAKYTSNFIPASTNPDILHDTPSGVSGSKLTKIVDGAVAFDGSGDYLSIGASSDFNLLDDGTFTIEFFFYANSLSGGYADYVGVFDGSNTGLLIYEQGGQFDAYINGAQRVTTTHPGANKWHHAALTRDGTTLRLFVDGVLKSTSTASLGSDYSGALQIGGANGRNSLNGFISNVRVIKGTALYTTDFTPPSKSPLTNVTNTKLLCCQSNTSAIEGAVKPGTITAAGNAAATTFNPFTTDINAVRGQESGYCTWNPLNSTAAAAFSDGNLNFTSSSGWAETISTINIPTTGKWYVEQIYRGGSSNLSPGTWGARFSYFGVCTNNYVLGSMLGGSNCLVLSDRNVISKFGTQTDASGAVTKGPGGIVSLALNRDDNTYEFFYQGVSIDSGTIGTTDSDLFFMVGHHPGNTASFDFNFGQKPYKFPPPAGFQPLNAANVRPETVITRPDQYVAATIYSGNQGTQSITMDNSALSPDFVWIKCRNDGFEHQLFDSVRGDLKSLRSDNSSAEATVANSLTSFNSNGFSLGSSQSVNHNKNFVAWTWKAGGKDGSNAFNIDGKGYASAAAAGITGLDGTGEMTTAKFLGCSIGTKQGFSIIKYKGLGGGDVKVPHGLSQTPDMVIVKNLDSSVDWAITHSSLPGNRSLRFTSATTSSSGFLGLNKGGLASTYFTINYSDTNLKYVNANNEDYIAYIWHNVPGLQKFGKWTNNNSNNGTFTELGFRPAILLLKDIDGGEQWYIIDSKRQTFNIAAPSSNGAAAVRTLQPSSVNDEATADNSHPNTTVDFLSNGFKIRSTNTGAGEISYGTRNYIYAAWAEAPVSGLYGAQSNAR